MPDLAACYFCGAALDDSLSTVSLGDGPDTPTLTLCAGCKEKLETVLAAVDREPEQASGSAAPGDSVGSTDAEAAPAAPSDDSPAEPADTSVDEPSPEPAASSPASRESDASSTDPSQADPAGDSDAADAPGSDAPGPDGERSLVEGDQEISALEYNKVMRLLQNREFPVDREEIVAVAANAYQVARADCDRVIDVAIDRGILEEADGQLLKPD